MNRSAREAKSVKRVERSNGLDTALYKNYLFSLFFTTNNVYFKSIHEIQLGIYIIYVDIHNTGNCFWDIAIRKLNSKDPHKMVLFVKVRYLLK